jgi:hypothetical protein
VNVRAQTRRDACRRRGFHSPRLLPPHCQLIVIWHFMTLDLRRAVRMGLAACPERRSGTPHVVSKPSCTLRRLRCPACVTALRALTGIEADVCKRARGGREGGSGVRTSSQRVDERGDAWSASRRRQVSSIEGPALRLWLHGRGGASSLDPRRRFRRRGTSICAPPTSSTHLVFSFQFLH